MEEFKVVIPYPKETIYRISASYPESAKRQAARKHKGLLPRMSEQEIFLIAHCFRVNPKSSGGRYKEPTFIEEMYKKYYGN